MLLYGFLFRQAFSCEGILALQEQLASCHAGHDGVHLKYQIISSSMRISRRDNGFTRYYSA